MVDNRVAEKLHGVISQLTDEYNNYHNKRIKKADVRNLINDLEVVDAELHELISPHNNNTVCMFYVITELKDIDLKLYKKNPPAYRFLELWDFANRLDYGNRIL